MTYPAVLSADEPGTVPRLGDIVQDYLGDGVYAVFTGRSLELDLRGQDRTTRIVLEPEVLVAMLRMAVRVGFVDRDSLAELIRSFPAPEPKA